MNQSPTYMKWFYRALLVLLASALTYVVTQPSYNFAHLVPHNLLRQVGISYASILWAESNADIFLHFFGAAVLTWLIHGARLPYLHCKRYSSFIVVCSLCIAAEVVQYFIGRGVETSDLLLGICGSFMAYLAIDKNN